MKIRRIMLGVLMMVCVVSSEASAWWWKPQPTVPVPPADVRIEVINPAEKPELSETLKDVLKYASNPIRGAVVTTRTHVPLKDGGSQTTTEVVVEPSKSGAMAGAAAGAALGAEIGTMIGGPAGAAIGAAVGATVGGIAGWILGPAG